MSKAWVPALKAVAGGLAVVLGLAVLLWPGGQADILREAATDRLLDGTAPRSGQVVVVDIDAESLSAIGPWPWPRARLAALLDQVTSAGPRAVGIDILLAGPDRFSPDQLAESLPDEEVDLRRRLAALPNADAALANVMGRAPTVLSALFATSGSDRLPPVPVLLKGDPPRLSPWAAPSVAGPMDGFATRAAGIGVSSLAGDGTGTVRDVPLMGTAGNAIAAGFAVELLRQSTGASAYILDGEAGILSVGEHGLPLARSVSMRFRPSGPATWKDRTVSALAVLDGRISPDRLRDRIVILGGSAPALGALRQTAASPVAPAAQIQADALETMLSGSIPVRPDWAGRAEMAVYAALAILGALAGAVLGPAAAALSAAILAAGWTGTAVALLDMKALVLDPVSPSLAALSAALAAGAITAIRQRRLAASIRRRFEQHLSPAIVARMADNPGLVRLEGERREISALYTDIEGFSALADRIGPQALITLLDDYFDGVVAAIVARGGMVDKFVGDAVLGFFNAPLDLDDHARKALEAAEAILAFTEAYRKTPAAAAAGLGRTRIGIECGDVVIGDVGSGDKVDYTAHGLAVNMASRLEGMNKVFGTSICLGPKLAGRLTGIPLTSLGVHEIRGCGTFEIFTPATR